MRDKVRIKPFLAKLEELWEMLPDYRFGQIIYLLSDRVGRDIFIPEESEWLEVLEKEIEIQKNFKRLRGAK